MLHGITELDPPRGNVAHPAADPYGIVVAGGLTVPDRHLTHGQSQSGIFQLPIAHATLPQVLGARDVEPDQITRVVDDAHLVGLGIIDSNPGLRDWWRLDGHGSLTLVDARDGVAVTR